MSPSALVTRNVKKFWYQLLIVVAKLSAKFAFVFWCVIISINIFFASTNHFLSGFTLPSFISFSVYSIGIF